jgi:diaminopimelate epimerase
MGTATFRSDRIPVAGAVREVVDEPLEVDGQRVVITAVSMGNPHCVVFVPDLAQVDLHRLGPKLERHPAFPARTNVQFAQVHSRRRVAAVIWERGAGETLASGSSACAVASAAVRKGLTERHVVVAMHGGELEIEVASDWSVRMSGPATDVYTGVLSQGFLAQLQAPEAHDS